jgi:uncharacterized protein YdeI (YjbR/CyaY-like superfamily)
MLTRNSVDVSLDERRSVLWKTRMKRKLHPVPDDVAEAISARGLTEAYRARPAYQRNDYVGWISRARRQETRDMRLRRMLDELQAGDVCMNMKWNGRAP